MISSGSIGNSPDVIIWDYHKKSPMFTLCEHDSDVELVKFSHDSKLLFSSGNSIDKKIFIWNSQNGYIVGSTFL